MDGNTVNPGQLSNMTSPVNQNQIFDFNMDDFENLDPSFFDQDNAFVDGILDGSAAPAFDPVNYSKEPQEVVPMQQSFASPATLTPTQVLPTPPPGVAYHPQVGWYYPVTMPLQFPPPPPASFGMAPPLAAPNAHVYAQAPAPAPPASHAPHIPAAPAEEVIKKPVAKRASRGTKRKYGPAAFLEEQANRRANGETGSPRPVSRDFNYPVPASALQPQRTPVKVAPSGSPSMKEMNMATVKRCRCASANKVTKAHIPRPRNAFMIFRNDFASHWHTAKGQKRGNFNTHISKAAGDAWAALEDNDGQAKYRVRAAKEKEEHKKQYPGYSYTPRKKIQAQFGTPDCECGAFETNTAELQRIRDGGATPPNNFTGASDAEDNGSEYSAPRTRSGSRESNYQVPTAQMVAPSRTSPRANANQAPTAQMVAPSPQYDLSFGSQGGATGLEWDAYQLYDSVTENNEAEQPPVKRRATRSSKKTVHYADGEVEDDGEANDEETASASRKHRPDPISTSRKTSSSTMSSINSADFKLFVNDNESVASRTRSKSISMSDDETLLPTNVSSPSSLFDDDGDNIVVASPRETRSQSRGRERRRS